MSPRVSEAARIFAVAAFLVLIAQGPTFSGHASQLAVAGQTCTQTMTKEGGMQTTCTNTKADTTVGADKGSGGTKESQDGPCTDKKMAAMSAEERAKTCPEDKKGTITAKGSSGGEDVTIPGGEGGMVSEGKGGGSSSGAVQSYANGDSSKQYLLTPPTPEGARIMNSAFPGVADGTTKVAYPVTPSDSGTSNAGGSSSPAPVSSVPGTTLDNSQPVNLNPNTMQNIAALTPPQTGADTPPITRSYISPSTGATLGTNGAAQASFTSDPLWKANQELGGVQSPVSPCQVFFAQSVHQDASVTDPSPRLLS
jgi:hypothetical protein